MDRTNGIQSTDSRQNFRKWQLVNPWVRRGKVLSALENSGVLNSKLSDKKIDGMTQDLENLEDLEYSSV